MTYWNHHTPFASRVVLAELSITYEKSSGTPATAAAVAAEPPTDTVARTPSLDQLSRLGSQRWSFDLDSLVARRVIRVLVTPNRMAYFLDGPRQRGSAYEAVQEFERELNRSLGSKTLQVECVFIPVPRDELLSRLADGRGDLAVGLIRATPERQARLDFSAPVYEGVRDVRHACDRVAGVAPGRG